MYNPLPESSSHPYGRMQVTLYRSALCPRCCLATKHLVEIAAITPEIVVEVVDVVTAPKRTWRDGVRMIPALKIDNRILSGLYLSRATIADFIANSKP